MVENMFFVDCEHAGMGEMLPPKDIDCFFVLYAWFLTIILPGHDFFGCSYY